MTTRRILLSISTAIAAIGAAPSSADERLASATGYGGISQATIVCRYTNVGTADVVFYEQEVVDTFGRRMPRSGGSCHPNLPSPLQPRKSCTFEATLPYNDAFACRAMVTRKDVLLGTVEFKNASGAILRSIEMQ